MGDGFLEEVTLELSLMEQSVSQKKREREYKFYEDKCHVHHSVPSACLKAKICLNICGMNEQGIRYRW